MRAANGSEDAIEENVCGDYPEHTEPDGLGGCRRCGADLEAASESAVLGVPPDSRILAPGRYRFITVRQPWAWLIVYGPKDIENRSWTVSHRGVLLIHAAKEMTRKEFYEGAKYARHRGVTVPSPESLLFGGIIGAGSLHGIAEPAAATSRWHEEGKYGWMIDNRRPLDFIPCKGGQGLRWFSTDQSLRLGGGA